MDIYYFVNFFRKNNEDYIDMIFFVYILLSNRREADLNKPTAENNK